MVENFDSLMNIFNTLPSDMLNTIRLQNTSAGVLCKWVVNNNDDCYYFKSGSKNGLGYFTDRQPYAEVMSYRIGLCLGFPNLVPTSFKIIHFDESEKYNEQDAVISFTKSFLCKDEVYVPIHKYFSKSSLNNNLSRLYELFTESFEFIKQDLDIMILFDFIIMNVDRHLNNFGIIELNNKPIRMSPLFDNGLSLLSYLSDEELTQASEFYLNSRIKVKPFKSDVHKQIKLVDVNNMPYDLKSRILNESIDWEFVFNGLDLSEIRKAKIKCLVEKRLDYVKDLLSKTM